MRPFLFPWTILALLAGCQEKTSKVVREPQSQQKEVPPVEEAETIIRSIDGQIQDYCMRSKTSPHKGVLDHFASLEGATITDSNLIYSRKDFECKGPATFSIEDLSYSKTFELPIPHEIDIENESDYWASEADGTDFPSSK